MFVKIVQLIEELYKNLKDKVYEGDYDIKYCWGKLVGNLEDYIEFK